MSSPSCQSILPEAMSCFLASLSLAICRYRGESVGEGGELVQQVVDHRPGNAGVGAFLKIRVGCRFQRFPVQFGLLVGVGQRFLPHIVEAGLEVCLELGLPCLWLIAHPRRRGR